MQKRRSLLPAMLFILIIAGICITILFGFNYAVSFTTSARELYGPASPRLSTLQFYRLSYELVRDKDILLNPVDPDGEQVLFAVESGEPADSVLARLQTNNLIPSQAAIRNYLIYTGLDTQIQAGEYYLSPAIPPVLVVHEIIATDTQIMEFNILPGWRLEEIADSLPTSGLNFTAGEFISATNTRPPGISFISELPLGASLEGFFLPGSYPVTRSLSADELIVLILTAFDENMTLELREGFSQQGLNLFQAVNLASIVQREAVLPEEQPLIASVFLNRLNLEMHLETDPTVQYALGYNESQRTWWTNPLTFDQLRIDSPYNTYLYPGLPPGPISNPGLEALLSVAFPAESSYLFFRAACDGSGLHNFSVTFEEHQANACP